VGTVVSLSLTIVLEILCVYLIARFGPWAINRRCVPPSLLNSLQQPALRESDHPWVGTVRRELLFFFVDRDRPGGNGD